MRLSSRAAKGEAQESKKGKKKRREKRRTVGRAVLGEPKTEVATKNTEKTKGGRREGKREGEQKRKRGAREKAGGEAKWGEAIFPLANGPTFGRMYPERRVPHGAVSPLQQKDNSQQLNHSILHLI